MMVRKCILCDKHWSCKESVSFHKFPQNSTRREQWLKIINKPPDVNNKSMLLCSDHFDPSCFGQPVLGNKRFLKPDAIPTLNLGTNDDYNPIEDISEEAENKVTLESVTKQTTTDDITNRKRKSENSDIWDNESHEFFNYKSIKDVNWEKIAHCPKKTKLCWDVAVEIVEEQRKEIKELKRKLNLSLKKVKNLETLVDNMKKKYLLSNSKSDNLKGHTEHNYSILSSR